MAITRLNINHVRNLAEVDIELSKGLNLFYGENGSGKTSILEAISLLAHGRSFRTVNYRQLITHNNPHLSVFGEVWSHQAETKIGIRRPQRGASIYRVNGEPVYTSTSLASILPLQVMNAKSFDLLEGPSKVRRRMFDWLVFHVKHNFASLWRDYSRAVKQRNSMLRHDKIARYDLNPWNIELNRLGVAIDTLRVECIKPFIEKVQQLLLDIGLPAGYTVDIAYQRGWPDEHQTLEQSLNETFDRDVKYGYTTQGAHKSEIKVVVNKIPASDVLSRGQQKSLIAAFLLAELQLYQELMNKPSVLLIDDLPAELDQHNIAVLAGWLKDLDTQVCVTGINLTDMNRLREALDEKPCKLFHVKHGEVKEEIFIRD